MYKFIWLYLRNIPISHVRPVYNGNSFLLIDSKENSNHSLVWAWQLEEVKEAKGFQASSTGMFVFFWVFSTSSGAWAWGMTMDSWQKERMSDQFPYDFSMSAQFPYDFCSPQEKQLKDQKKWNQIL